MAISNAVQRDTFVYIYDEQGQHTGTVAVTESGPDDGLKGYSSSSVNVRIGPYIYSYDEKGNQTGYMPV